MHMLSKIVEDIIESSGIKRPSANGYAVALDYANPRGRKRSTLVDFIDGIHAI